MGILKAIFGSKDIEIEQLEILFHTEAAYFGEHGRIIASNRALGIVEREVIFCLKGHTTPLPLNHRLFAHIWKEAQAQGFIPLELAKYGKVVENAADTDPVAAHRRVLAILREHGQAPEIAEIDRVIHRLDVSDQSGDEAAAAVAQAGKTSARDFSNVDVPTFLRQGKKEGEDGFQTSGFVAATTRG
jgi:hypothetical protein